MPSRFGRTKCTSSCPFGNFSAPLACDSRARVSLRVGDNQGQTGTKRRCGRISNSDKKPCRDGHRTIRTKTGGSHTTTRAASLDPNNEATHTHKSDAEGNAAIRASFRVDRLEKSTLDSDGQLLLAAVDAGKEASIRLHAKSEQDRIQDVRTQKSHTALRLERLGAEESADRDSLFDGMTEKATNYVFGREEEEDAKRPAEQVEGLTASLGQTRDALNQRGEQLTTLNDKSAKMVDASSDFARMAKELRKKSEAGWFG
jgi:hypothetical protein